VVAERIHCCDRHGVDGVRADQLFDVEDVAIGLVLGAGRGPEQPLGPRAMRSQRVPARAGEQTQIALISELGVGDGDLALETCKSLFFIGVVRLGDLFVE
jgi:hypothetical protein